MTYPIKTNNIEITNSYTKIKIKQILVEIIHLQMTMLYCDIFLSQTSKLFKRNEPRDGQ